MKCQYKRMHFARDNPADKISGFHKLKTKTAANTSRKLFHTSWKKKIVFFLSKWLQQRWQMIGQKVDFSSILEIIQEKRRFIDIEKS